MKYEGRVWKFGDDVDTDLIIAARYCNVSDGALLAKHAFADGKPEFASAVSRGRCHRGGKELRLRFLPGARPHRDQGGGGLASSSRRASPGSSTAMPSTSGCRSSSRPRPPRIMQDGDRLSVDLIAGKDREPHPREILPGPPDPAVHGAAHQGRRARGAHPQGKASEAALACNRPRFCPRRSYKGLPLPGAGGLCDSCLCTDSASGAGAGSRPARNGSPLPGTGKTSRLTNRGVSFKVLRHLRAGQEFPGGRFGAGFRGVSGKADRAAAEPLRGPVGLPLPDPAPDRCQSQGGSQAPDPDRRRADLLHGRRGPVDRDPHCASARQHDDPAVLRCCSPARPGKDHGGPAHPRVRTAHHGAHRDSPVRHGDHHRNGIHECAAGDRGPGAAGDQPARYPVRAPDDRHHGVHVLPDHRFSASPPCWGDTPSPGR